MTSIEMVDQALSQALDALRERRPEEAVDLLLAIRPIAAGASPLSHAAVLLRLAQARLAQSEMAADPHEAATRALQAHGAALECSRRLEQGFGLRSSIGERADQLRLDAAERLLALSPAAA